MPRPPHGRRASSAAVVAGLIVLAAAPAAFGDEAEPQMVVGGIEPVSGLRPGDTFDLPVTVANKGTVTAGKAWVSYSVTRGLDFVDVPSNCRVQHVRSYDEMPEYWTATCAYDQAVEPGVVLTPEKPLRVEALDRAYHDRLRLRVGYGDAPPDDENGEPSVPGTAPAVKLVEGPAGGAGSAEYLSAPVTTVNTADYQVTGAALSGKVGDTVTMKVGFRNAGPAWLLEEEAEQRAQVMVTPPAGTSVVKRDYYCHADGKAYTYTCPSHLGMYMAEDNQMVFTFKLRIDKRIAGAKGSIALTPQRRPFDPDKANDKADITLEVTGGGSTGSTGGSGGSGGSTGGSGGSTGGSGNTGGSTGGSSSTGGGGTTDGGTTTGGGTTPDGGNLADTGSSALPITGAAAAAVLAGAGALLVVRRRRARNLS